MYAPYKKLNLPKFLATSYVRCRVDQYAAMLPGWQTWKKSKLNLKLKISNTADNADITQSQARDTISSKAGSKQLVHR